MLAVIRIQKAFRRFLQWVKYEDIEEANNIRLEKQLSLARKGMTRVSNRFFRIYTYINEQTNEVSVTVREICSQRVVVKQ